MCRGEEEEDPLIALSLQRLQNSTMPLFPAFQLFVSPKAGSYLSQVAFKRRVCYCFKTRKGVLELGKRQERQQDLLEQGLKLKPTILLSDCILSGPYLSLKSKSFVENSWKLTVFIVIVHD